VGQWFAPHSCIYSVESKALTIKESAKCDVIGAAGGDQSPSNGVGCERICAFRRMAVCVKLGPTGLSFSHSPDTAVRSS